VLRFFVSAHNAPNLLLSILTISSSIIMGHREGPAVYEFAVDRFSDLALLRVSLAVELVKAG
jgi:hypothetical protein